MYILLYIYVYIYVCMYIYIGFMGSFEFLQLLMRLDRWAIAVQQATLLPSVGDLPLQEDLGGPVGQQGLMEPPQKLRSLKDHIFKHIFKDIYIIHIIYYMYHS